MSRFVDDLLLLAKAERQDFLRIERGRAGRAHRRAAREGDRASGRARGRSRRAARRRIAGRPPAPHAGDDGPGAERGPAHRGRRRGLDRHRRRRRRGVAVGARHRPGHPARGPGARSSSASPAPRASPPPLRGRRARAGDRARDRRGPRRPRRAREHAGRRIDLHRCRAAGRTGDDHDEPHPDRRGRAAAVARSSRRACAPRATRRPSATTASAPPRWPATRTSTC